MPHLRWQGSERVGQLSGLRLWLDEAALPNTPAPLELGVGGAWPRGPYDAAFTANTLHIMAWEEVARMFERLANVLAPGGPLAVYGPFHRDDRPTSPSNAAFDAWLRAQSAHLGVRDAAAVDALARPHGFALQRGAGDAGAQPAAPVAARRALTPARCRARLDGPALFRRGSLR